jgi:poly-gamma-glutamate capsule biosynthesis protein CapA/YwtB (metallophosphatase superfamily)
MPPEYLEYFSLAHISAVNQANNHAMDFGNKGFYDTRKFLDKYGIKYVGLKNEVLAYNIRGLKIAIIGFAWFDFSNNLLKENEYIPFIRNVALSNDIVIVEVHGGGEGDYFLHVRDRMEYFWDGPRGNMVRFSHLAIDNGASIILGSGPHVPRAMEIYKNKLIAYSLGNFVVYGMFSTEGYMKYSLILNAVLTGRGDFAAGKIIPLMLFTEGPYRGIPHFDEKGGTIELISELSRSDIPNNNLFISEDGTLSLR